MVIVTNGAFIERKAEENEERALDALEAAVAELASTMKDLRRATDRFGRRMSTAISKTEQIKLTCTALSSSMVELRNSLHSLEQTTNRLVHSPLPVAPSTMASHHRHVPLPVIPSITGSIPPSFSTSPQYSASTFTNSSLSSNSSSVAFSTTKLLRTSVTEPWPTLTRIEKPHPHASPDFRFEKPPTKFFTQNGLNAEALWASQNVFDGFFRTTTDQSKASVLAPDPTLHGLNNLDPVALVIDQTRDAVFHNKGKPPLLSTDDLVQPDAKLEHKKIEAPVLFRCMAPLLHPVNNLEMKILPVPSSANSANLNANSGQIHICSPHAHGSDFQGISSHGQVSNTCTFLQDSAAKLQDACPIPRRVDVRKLTIEDAEFGQNPRDGHVLISGPELISDSLPILEMQEPGHQPLIKQFSDKGGVQQYSINRTENPASAQRDVLGFNPNADINSGDDPLLTQIPAPAAKKMSMQLTEICHSRDLCASLYSVRSFGTEGRRKDGTQVSPIDKVYEYVVFRGTDIKDLQVKSSQPVHFPSHVPNDPAIIQSQYLQVSATSTSSSSATYGPASDLSTQMAEPDLWRSPFQGSPPLYQPGGSLGSWGSSTQPPSNCSGLVMPMYCQGFHRPPSSSLQTQEKTLLQSSHGLPMPPSLQQSISCPMNVALPARASNWSATQSSEFSPLLLPPIGISSLNLQSTIPVQSSALALELPMNSIPTRAPAQIPSTVSQSFSLSIDISGGSYDG